MNADDYYQQLISRNIGILTKEEQLRLKQSCVAVAGCGCIGALSAELLARAGVGCFKVADPDVFEISNINRQVTALSSTVGQNKAEVLSRRLKDINPDIVVEVFSYAINKGNVDDFVSKSTLVIDGLDYYAFEDMLSLHRAAERNKLPVLTAVAVAFGGNYFAFDEKSQSFEEYVGIRDKKTF